MARTVLLLAEQTGWSEAAILSLPVERQNSYVEELNKLNEERSNQ
jgi:hypothetical protein